LDQIRNTAQRAGTTSKEPNQQLKMPRQLVGVSEWQPEWYRGNSRQKGSY
jgi:hypothetical protein